MKHFRKQKRSGAYMAQFAWPSGPAVRIVSHAHLPLIFGSAGPHAALNTADLLVIDEDPLGALLIDSLDPDAPKFTAAALLAQPDPTAQALGKLLQKAEGGNHTDYETFFQDFRGAASGHGLYGQVFWDKLLTALTAPHDPVGFENALRAIAPDHKALVHLLARAFDDDLAATPSARLIAPSHRFGLHGVVKHGGIDFQLRYNLRQPLQLTCPTLVLDAYAHPDQYQALFREHTVDFHRFKLSHKLEVEHAPLLHVNPMDECRDRRAEGRRLVAEELVELHKQNPGRGQFIITPRSLMDPRSKWRAILDDTYARAGVSLGSTAARDPALGYWFAGRGVNKYAGADVIALTPPHLPKMHRVYTLAALFSTNEAKREELHHHLEGAEHLQLLHRGRQHEIYRTGKPRVIAADVRSLRHASLAAYVDLREYRSILPFTKWSNTPRWRAATEAVALELLESLGGVPREALEALGLVKTNGAPSTKLQAFTTLDTLAALWHPRTHIYQALRSRDKWQYVKVRPAADNSRKAEKEVMARLKLGEFEIQRKGQKGKPLVYGRDRPSAEGAYTEFQRLKALVHEPPALTPPVPSTVSAASSRS